MTLDLATATAGDFAAYVGTDFALEDAPSLRLAAVEERGGGGPRTPFSLLFEGPASPVLPQGIRRLRHPDAGALEVFLVPLGPDAGGNRYEAAFG